jgi:DNA-binding NtrC family response regulator
VECIVLFVDDEPNVLELFKRQLRQEEFKVLTACSAVEALDTLSTQKVDIVISDQNMPGMAGCDFLAKVREKHPQVVRFMLTGTATFEVAVRAVNTGAISHFMTKPVNVQEMVPVIKRAMNERDLVSRAWQLLKKTKEQEQVIRSLEQRHPGITELKKDDEGSIVLDYVNEDTESMIQEINDFFERDPLTPMSAGGELHRNR